jgi:hypothetical protein
MIQIGLWFAGFIMGIGLGGKIGQLMERRDWDKLIRDGVLPTPGQRWKPEDYEKSEKSEK